MQYCLEMDLVSSDKGRELYYDYFHLEGDARNSKALLIDRKDKIKEPSILLPIVKGMEPKDYPISYKKIRHYLSDRISEL